MQELIKHFVIDKDPQNRPFVSIHTQKENFRQIAAGYLYIDNGEFVINVAPYQRQITEEATGGAFELQERATEERKYMERARKDGTPAEKPKYLILISQRGFGLSPAISNAIDSNFNKAISQPLLRANDELQRQMNDPNGAYNKIINDIKWVFIYVLIGIFLISVFSGVTTEAINNLFGVKPTMTTSLNLNTVSGLTGRGPAKAKSSKRIGRASCRERV